MVQVLAPVVEAELALFEVEEEGVGVDSAEACQACLGVAPEAFDAVDVVAACGSAAELASRVIDAQVLLVAQVHQAVVALEPVGVDHRSQIDFAADRGQNRVLRAVLDDLGIDLAVAFADAEDDGLAAGTAAGLSLDTPRAEVRFVEFDVAPEGSIKLARLGHAFAKAGQQAVDGVADQAGEPCDLDGGEIDRHVPQKPAELVL